MSTIRGICPIIAAPFTESGEVDFESLKNLLRALIKGGCHGLTLFGIASEYYKLNDQERREMLRVAADECKAGGVPLIVSITQHATELAVKEAQHAEDAGADCLMVLPPFFLNPPAAELYRHMKMIGEAVKLPLMIQYVPQHTGVPVDPAVFAKLTSEVGNIIYYKIECKPPGPYITRLLAATQNQVRILVGNAGFQLPEGLERGAVGAMPGCSMYEIYLNIFDLYSSGRKEEAIRVHNVLLPMLNHILQTTEMIIYYEKRVLKRRGFIATDYCRRPAFIADAYYDGLFERYYEQICPYLS